MQFSTENHFHPRHSIILELKLSAVNKMCRDPDTGSLITSDIAALERKEALCSEVTKYVQWIGELMLLMKLIAILSNLWLGDVMHFKFRVPLFIVVFEFQVMDVLNIVYPGLSKYRGLVYHEHCEALITRVGILFNTETISKVN